MASLSSLRSDLRYWESQRKDFEAKLKKLKERKNDVEGVKNQLKNIAGNNSGDVNAKIRSAAQKLENAIEYAGKEGQLDSIFSGKEERAVGGDGNLSSADSEIVRELNSIDRQISEAESSLATAKSKISSIKSAIAAEEQRQREEAARAAAKAIKNLFK
jgi:prefoldin subunit 5